MSFGKIKALAERVADAERRLLTELEKDFPLGAKVRCWIMHGQVNASTGEVISHSPRSLAPTVRVRLDSRKQEVRDVPVWDVRVLDSEARGRNDSTK